MIDTKSESLVSLHEAISHFPARRMGKKPSVSCLYRWTTKGCDGVKLDSIQVGGTRCTSVEAIHRFIDGMTKRKEEPPVNQEDNGVAGKSAGIAEEVLAGGQHVVLRIQKLSDNRWAASVSRGVLLHTGIGDTPEEAVAHLRTDPAMEGLR